jgi:uncharacterized protein (TIGR02301 family)
VRQLLFVLLLLWSVPAAGSVHAQSRPPAARGSLVDLAHVLGQAHGLAQVCDASSQLWRARMMRLIELETPDEAFRNHLFDRFNTGYSAAQARHPRCGAGARAEASRVAVRGRDLARVIASAR